MESTAQSKHINNPESMAGKLYETVLKRHNDAGHPLNILLFLVDNGFHNKESLGIINKEIIDSYSNGGFTILMNIPIAFGGTGENIKTWILCDLPVSTYVSIKLNNGKILSIHKKIIENINSMMDENGWRCKNCGNIGKFRGPGKKDDECPLATLNILRLLSLTKSNDYLKEKEKGIETLLGLWNDRKERRPYLFGMGTDFCKIKYPLIWYDILNVVHTLSNFRNAICTKEFKGMMKIMEQKISQNGYKPESVYRFWKEFDFGQKKSDSEYIKNTILSVRRRIN